MVSFAPTHPLDEFFSRVSSGGNGDVQVQSVEGHGLVQVFASKGKTAAVEKALAIKETPGEATHHRSYHAIPLAPGQWFLISAKPDPKNFAGGLSKKLKKDGYVSEQADSRVLLRLSGDRVGEMMQKGCRLDLHPSVTGKGWCAQTQIAQCGVILHQIDDKPTYDILVYSGFAQHFAEWLEHTGAQLGISFSR
ncbi:MAG: sarcosine oxidase subunit gamma family protein [Pseudomonadota bacterium]